MQDDDGLAWGATHKKTGPTHEASAFNEPVLIDDISVDRNDDDEQQNHDAPHDHQVNPPPKNNPNIAILALVGVLGLGLLGGVGWAVTQKFNAKSAKTASDEIPLAASSTATAVSFPLVEPKLSASPSVFDAVPETLTAPGAPASAVAAASAPVVPPVVSLALSVPTAAAVSVVGVDGAGSVAAVKPVDAPLVAVVPAKVAATTASSSTGAVAVPAASSSTSAPSSIEPKKTATVNASVNGSDAAVDTKKQPSPKAVKAAAKHKTVMRKPVVVLASGSRREATAKTVHVARHSRIPDKTMEAQQSLPIEEFVLPNGMKVSGIYPTTGPNAQAWIADGHGKVEIVRVGESLRSGPQVLSISGEKGQVGTTAGIISSNGVQR